jgi:hypothetical protein
MARSRSARSVRSTGIPAAAWFYSTSFHSTVVVPAPVAPAPVAVLEALETIDPRERMMDALEDERILADRDLELELDYRAAREGDACGRSCGYCGRCS